MYSWFDLPGSLHFGAEGRVTTCLFYFVNAFSVRSIFLTDAEDNGSLLFAHDPYFTLIWEPELETELLTVTEVEFEEALNDTIAENVGFVAPNYDYLTTLAPMKTVEDIDGDNFIAIICPFHDTDQVCKNIGYPNTGLIWSHDPENPVGGAPEFTTPYDRRYCSRQNKDDSVTLESRLLDQWELWCLLNSLATCGT